MRNSGRIILAAAVFVLVFVFFMLFNRYDNGANTVAILQVTAMAAGTDPSSLKAALLAKPGVASVTLDSRAGMAAVTYDARSQNPYSLAAGLGKNGFTASVRQVLDARNYAELLSGNSGGCSSDGCGNCDKARK
jgi:hypothetical protein